MAHAEEVLWQLDKTRDILVANSTNLARGDYRWIQGMETIIVRVEVDGEDISYEESKWIGEGQLVKTRNTPKEFGWTEACVQGEEQLLFLKGF